MKHNIRVSNDFKKALSVVLTNVAGIPVNETSIPDSVNAIKEKLEKHGYITYFNMAIAVYLALKRYQPLLIEGPPGSGKTLLAYKISEAFNLPLIRVQCYEGIEFSDLVGHWDYQAQLLAIQGGESKESIYTMKYFEKGPLLEAIVMDKNNVLLIDEFDKTDEETEALFLEYLGERRITIPHIGTIDQNKLGNKTYVFITSNQYRKFTEAFLRRCLYIYIDYPDIETEIRIIKINVPDADVKLIIYVASLMKVLRDMDLYKRPTPYEAIKFTQALVNMNMNELNEDNIKRLLPIIIKTRQDMEYVLKNMTNIIDELKILVAEVTGKIIEKEREKKEEIIEKEERAKEESTPEEEAGEEEKEETEREREEEEIPEYPW